MTVAIEVHGLRKAYGEHEAVRGIDFTVQRGEVFGLLGPQRRGQDDDRRDPRGLPRARPPARSACSASIPASAPPSLRERVGIVLQSCGIYRHLTVRESVEHWAGLYPAPRDVEEVIEVAGLTRVRRASARGSLSGGQQRRLDFALALIGDPELIFLDEPTTGFDPAARRNAWETVRSLRDLGKTILLTTHYLDEAQALADRVAIIKDGAILAEGPPMRARRRRRATASAGPRRAARSSTRRTTRRALLHEATGAALARGETLEALEVSRPSLEDVYLDLTAEPVA